MTGQAPSMQVDPWSDHLSGLLERLPWLGRMLGGWESALLRERLEAIPIDCPVYIAGLARSGSTILLELLARHPEAATHRYRDFPPILLPWAWNWFVDRAGRDRQAPTERAHRDRIAVTPESPEAFEELLWMAFLPGLHDPARSAILDGRERYPRFEAFYRDHIRKILLLRGGSRYLAKGNYDVTRLRYLLALFPEARFLVPIRDPVWHIASLIKQQRLFAAAGSADARVRRHLRRSGHFEFGLDRRPINTGDAGQAARVEALWRAGEEVQGWAMQWAGIYGHVADMLEEPVLAAAIQVVRYEDFCADPAAVMTEILAHCGLGEAGLPEMAARTVRPPDYYRPGFERAECEAIQRHTGGVARRFGYG